ncbi:ImmA/IrrE family metallo-endopeptidase [Clostridium sp. AN503]|uniref:ImmA/IrrE family metallo-endopeptidase n=1 Tax=Clostridium sp. AN503 TaxID=3160598 RepID=UPI003457E7D2
MEISPTRYQKIKSTIANCKTLFRTTDPFKICELLGFKVYSVKLGSNLHGFADVKQTLASSINQRKEKLYTVKANIYLSDSLDSYSKKIVCAHELGHVLLQYKEELNLFESTNETKDIKEYEANLFAIELLPQIYNNFSIDYHDLNKEEMQAFMNKKISHIIYSL